MRTKRQDDAHAGFSGWRLLGLGFWQAWWMISMCTDVLLPPADRYPFSGNTTLWVLVLTTIGYLVTVALLILPYLLFDESHYLWAMGTMVVIVLLILVVFNSYLSVAQDLPFKKRFGQMAGISLGVAALSFVIGILVKQFLGVDI